MDMEFKRVRLSDGAHTPVQVSIGLSNVFLNCSGAGLVVPGLGARLILKSNYRWIAYPSPTVNVIAQVLPMPSLLTDWGVLLSTQIVNRLDEIQAVGVVVADMRVGRGMRKNEFLIIPEGTPIGCLLVSVVR